LACAGNPKSVCPAFFFDFLFCNLFFFFWGQHTKKNISNQAKKKWHGCARKHRKKRAAIQKIVKERKTGDKKFTECQPASIDLDYRSVA
jgi:hypothetical protein